MKTTLLAILTLLLSAAVLFNPPPYMTSAVILEKLDKEDRKKYEKADEFFQTEKWEEALEIYKELIDSYPEDLFFKYRAGICYLHIPSERHEATALLESVEAGAPEFLEAKFYLGRAYHFDLRFEEAADKIRQFAQGAELEGDDSEIINRYIEYCVNGKNIIERETEWEVKSMGGRINSENSEYVPLMSPEEDVLYFTYKTGGHKHKHEKPNKKEVFYEDVYISYEKGGVWSNPESVSQLINTDKHDAALAISIDGQRLFIYKSNKKDANDIFMSKLDGNDWLEPQKLKGDVNSKYWEGSACLASNGRTLYFSSDRPGGYGGRDLYSAVLQPDGSWGQVKNLGATINTSYDEDGPFIHADNKTLYFSSDGHETMGDHDIFYTVNSEDGWTVPENVGYPISTPDDDRYFIVSMDGKRGYFSSQKAGGFGHHDIYMAYDITEGDPTILAYINAKVLLDGQPVEAEVRMLNQKTNNIYGYHSSNAITGFVKMVVNQGENLKIEVSIPGRDDVPMLFDTVNVTDLDRYIEVNHTYNLYTEEYLELTGINEDDEGSLDLSITNALREAKGLPPIEKEPIVEAEPTPEPEEETPVEPEPTPEPVEEPVTASTEETIPAEALGPCGGPVYIDFVYFEGKDLNDTTYYNQLIRTAGNYCSEGLIFEVQIGAYRFPLNFKYPHLRSFGSAEIRDYPDEITRFTMGSFNNLKDAEALRLRIIKAGQFDAWITPFYDGKRYLMQELIAVDFYGKAVN